MSIASGYGPNWTTAESRGLDAQRRVVELEQQLAAAQAEARELRAEVERLKDAAVGVIGNATQSSDPRWMWVSKRALDRLAACLHPADSPLHYRPAPEPAPAPELLVIGVDLAAPGADRTVKAVIKQPPEHESLPLMARRSWMRRDTDYFVVHGDFCLEIKALNGRAPYFDESGELVVCAEAGDSIERDQVDAEAQPDGIYRIADTDEHGLPVIERTADMPEGAKYRLTWIMQADAAGGDVEYTDSLPLALEANRSGAVSERIEDYRPTAREGDGA